MDRNTKSEHWIEVRIEADLELHEAIVSYLFELNCTGTALSDENRLLIKAYFPGVKDSKHTLESISRYIHQVHRFFPRSREARMQVKHIENQGWAENWRKFFSQQRVSSQLTIVPAWEKPNGPTTEKVLFMDPGPAFGTGKHPTTIMCLQALEDVAQHQPKWDMLDVGTGSGILAIYAAVLGATRILAIDIDPEALRWAKRNARLNHVNHIIVFSLKPLENLVESYSVVTANLVYEDIMQLKEKLSTVTAFGGTLILSGLLKDQVKEVVHEFQSEGLNLNKIENMGEWAAIILKRGEAGGH
ncbi:MAG: 50S ribosomal protein L11 methyltransferase [Deltaproteobacteria bacterium]|nr:MAG: 50S ribosomal protein L11 methyltransferase [Deltaproteobacteria bacterium]